MKLSTKITLGIVVILAGAGLALGTPLVGLVSPLLAVGKQNADMHAHGSGTASTGQGFSVEIETEGPATLTTQLGSVGPGGHNGWHSHPGLVFVTLMAGSITWYDENCVPTEYKAGDSWVEGTKPHAYRVTSTTAIQSVAWFIIAQGQPYRTDLPAPACAAGLGF